jgi:hydroxymethylpyrimidine pyrophosphatase-like HAD family hydrolase
MQLSVLALDYDGTPAQDGILDPEVRQVILEVHAHDITVVIVTERILDDLRRVMGDLRLVDAVVAENGAVVVVGSRPSAATRIVMSRSVRIPWKRLPTPTITDPMLRACIRLAAS